MSTNLLDPDPAALVRTRTQVLHEWADRYGVPREQVIYSPQPLATGGGATFRSGQIALDRHAFNLSRYHGVSPELSAEAIFAHETGHRFIGYRSGLSTAGELMTEIEASRAGAYLSPNPQVRDILLNIDIPTRLRRGY
jgi:hypothetical protein